MVYPNNQSLMELEEEKRSEVAESDKSEKDNLEWTSDLEVSLFYSMVGHKPVGPNRFFQMYFVHQNFCSLICKDVDVSVIWKKLETMYDLATLDESESVTTKGEKFALPLSIFGEFMEKAKLGLTDPELSTPNSDKPEVQSKENNSEGSSAKSDEIVIKKEELEVQNSVTPTKDVQKSDSSVKAEIVKPVSGKRESKESKKINVKEKDKKDASARKEVQDTIKTEPKDTTSKKDDDKEVAKRNEKVKRDHKENKKTPKKESQDKKTPEPQKKENESKKESSKKIDSKLETTKSTRVETLKKESLSDKRKESPDKKTEVKTTDKKTEVKTTDKKTEVKTMDKKGDHKTSDKKNDLNKSLDRKNESSKSSDKKGEKSSEKKTDSKSSERKSDANKSAEKKSEKKVDKKSDKSLNRCRTPETGSNSGRKTPDGSGKSGGKTTDVTRKVKEKKDSESEKPDKESFSLKRLRDSWSSDDTPVKRPKGRPTRNSGEAVIKPSPSNTVPGKRRRVL